MERLLVTVCKFSVNLYITISNEDSTSKWVVQKDIWRAGTINSAPWCVVEKQTHRIILRVKKKMASFQSSRDFHWSILSTQYLAHTGFPFVYGGAGGRDTPGDYQLSMHTGLSHIREIPAECESV